MKAIASLIVSSLAIVAVLHELTPAGGQTSPATNTKSSALPVSPAGLSPAAKTVHGLLSSRQVRPGVCLHIECGQGKLTAELALGGQYVVQGLTADAASLDAARKNIQAAGVYGQVSAALWSQPASLPYADNLANLIVIEDWAAAGKRGLTMAEVVRVLAPYGTVMLGGQASADDRKQGGLSEMKPPPAGWTLLQKPYPPEMDNWGQVRYDASRSAISKDQLVGPPTGVRWINGDRWISENDSWGMLGIYSSGGRVFYLMADESKKTRILARDAFNGQMLWQRVSLHPSPLFIADQDRVYTLLEARKPLVALDAATGEQVLEYGFSASAIILTDGMLITGPGKLAAYDARTGKQVWQSEAAGYAGMVAAEGCVFLKGYGKPENAQLICLDAKTGKIKWQVPNEGFSELACARGGLLLTEATIRARPAAGEGGHSPEAVNRAYSIADGKPLWTFKYKVHWHQGRPDVFLMGDQIWLQDDGPPQSWVALDAKTGQEKQRLPVAQRAFLRCYSDLATERYILEDVGIACLDVRQGKFASFYGGRGTCGGGYRPANGLIYKSSDICVCFAQVRGQVAYSAQPAADLAALRTAAGPALQKGPAFGQASAAKSQADPWPAYRHDGTRGGATETKLGPKLDPLWQAKIGKLSTQAVIPASLVLAAAPDEHRVAALQPDTGKEAWSFTAGGRIDSPPTCTGQLVLFGSADGYVYCLKQADGQLVWRMRAAAAERMIPVRGQLESVWPIAGSVLANDGVAYFAAGRHSETDGGIEVFAVKADTGQPVWQQLVRREKMLQQQFVSDVKNTMGGILSMDGKSLYMDRCILDMATGKPLDKATGTFLYGGACGFTEDVARPPYGFKHPWRLWGLEKSGIFGKKIPEMTGSGVCFRGSTMVRLHSERNEVAAFSDPVGRPQQLWSVKLPEKCRGKAILMAADHVAVAIAREPEPDGKGLIIVLSLADGAEKGRLELDAAPAFDGLSTGNGRLFVATRDGRLICLQAGQ
ncbi:MAG: PQQ-binding-like beta-propeller repeat protein [Planctomycetes bacterium]|nr:PQQ-binding-like beta-propeller repeat protein [Planctomycetota bacterium]